MVHGLNVPNGGQLVLNEAIGGTGKKNLPDGGPAEGYMWRKLISPKAREKIAGTANNQAAIQWHSSPRPYRALARQGAYARQQVFALQQGAAAIG